MSFAGLSGFSGFATASDIYAMGGPAPPSGGPPGVWGDVSPPTLGATSGLARPGPFAPSAPGDVTGVALTARGPSLPGPPPSTGYSGPVVPPSVDGLFGEERSTAGVAEYLDALGATWDTPSEVFLSLPEEDLATALAAVTEEAGLSSVAKAGLIRVIRDLFERAGFEPPRLGTVARRAARPQVAEAAPTGSLAHVPAAAEPDADLVNVSVFADQASRLQARRLSYGELAGLRQVYVATCGAPPPDAQLPTSEQLAALAAILRSGRPPYVDFAVWSPLGPRLARFRRTEAAVLVGNVFVTKTLDAPPSHAAWEESYNLFAAAMITLGAAAPGTLQSYLAGVRRLLALFPSRWPAIAGAELLVRSERWSRIREELEATAPVWTPAPWDRVIAASTFGLGGPGDTWWNLHLVLPLTAGAPLDQAGLPTSAAASSAGPRVPHAGARRGEKRSGSQPTARSSPAASSGEFCRLWNSRAGNCKGNGACPFRRRHVCSVCEGAHRAIDNHSEFKDEGPTKKPRTGAGGAKGQGKDQK